MDAKDWLSDFTKRMEYVEDDILASILVKTVDEYTRMIAMSPDMQIWFMQYSSRNTNDLLTLSSALELRIRSHQENGEMMLTPHLMVLMFVCKGITDPSLTSDVIKLWEMLKSRALKHIESIGALTANSYSEETVMSAKKFRPNALYQRHSLIGDSNSLVIETSTQTYQNMTRIADSFHKVPQPDQEVITASKLLLIPTALCCLGILPMPYDFYLLLRVIVCSSAALVAYYDFRSGNESWIIFAVLGALFNPFVPVYLNKPMWIVIDLAAAGLFYWRYQKNGSPS